MSERRTDRMLDVARSHGLPAFLADDPGVDSGLMIAQYTQAAIVSEMKRLAVPASVDSIPSSAMQEDHVSMGWSAARKLRRSVDGLSRVIAIEMLTAARALDLRAPLPPAPATAAAVVRALAHARAGPGADRWLSPEIEAAVELTRAGAFVDAPREAVDRTTAACSRATLRADARASRTLARFARRAARTLSCSGWPQEAALRMLMNNLDPEVAERPDDLVVYGGTGKAARDWKSLRRDRAHAADAQGRRDDARAVGRAGRGVAHARVGAARADRELEPGRRLGEPGLSSAGSRRSV